MIVFVYDTAKCCKEEDDPAEAVMYFHPAWVSLTQRLALAGQLMGVHHFLTTSFSAPHCITLQGGKFVLKRFGQYVLVSRSLFFFHICFLFISYLIDKHYPVTPFNHSYVKSLYKKPKAIVVFCDLVTFVRLIASIVLLLYLIDVVFCYCL